MPGKKKRLKRRIILPLIIATIVGASGYAWKHYGTYFSSDITVTTTSSAVMPTPPEPLPSVNAVVMKRGAELQLSVKALPHRNLRSVEYYVEDHFVGAAYTEPYSVSLQEGDLTVGNHTVTAKIITSDETAAAIPATFSTQPSADSPPASGEGTKSVVISTPSVNRLTTPGNVATTINSSSTNVVLSWEAVERASQYQIWRDGVQVAMTATPTYTDSNVVAGQTYAYQLAATNDANDTSELSGAISVAIPLPATSSSTISAPTPTSSIVE